MEEAKGMVVSTRTGLPLSAGQPSTLSLRFVLIHKLLQRVLPSRFTRFV